MRPQNSCSGIPALPFNQHKPPIGAESANNVAKCGGGKDGVIRRAAFQKT
jgi:hypothetical protein